jgi:hypothetical protein
MIHFWTYTWKNQSQITLGIPIYPCLLRLHCKHKAWSSNPSSTKNKLINLKKSNVAQWPRKCKGVGLIPTPRKKRPKEKEVQNHVICRKRDRIWDDHVKWNKPHSEVSHFLSHVESKGNRHENRRGPIGNRTETSGRGEGDGRGQWGTNTFRAPDTHLWECHNETYSFV